jgi:hypothetical protein
MSQRKRALGFLALTVWFWGLAAWLCLVPPEYLIGEPTFLYAFLFGVGGVLSAYWGWVSILKSKGKPASKGRTLWVLILLTGALSLFPPDLARPYYPPAPRDGEAQGKALIFYPVGLPEADAACPNSCIINVCVRWVLGPSPRCPRPGPGGGCCLAYEQDCDPDCDDPGPDPVRPPSILGIVACDLWGTEGWCREAANLVLSASDPQGYGLEISGEAGYPFACSGNASCVIPLPEGTGTASYTATASTSGLSASGSADWKYDPEPPEPGLAIEGTPGGSGWYLSEVQVSAGGSDGLSGLAAVELTVESVPAEPLTFLGDGVHSLVVTARDQAGNQAEMATTIQVDGTPPASHFTSPDPKSVVSGVVEVVGESLDETSGLSAVELSFDGETWTPLDLKESQWSYAWDTTLLPNGDYALLVRGLDQAGNREAPVRLDLTVQNLPPVVAIPASWRLWEPAPVTVRPRLIPLGGAQIVVYDPAGRWPARRYAYEPERIPASFTWDRRFRDGTLAPPGTYRVLVEAWDLFGNSASDTGRLVIPVAATPTPTPTGTVTPSPTATPTQTPTRTPAPWLTPVSGLVTVSVPVEKPVDGEVSLPLWPLAGLVGWFVALSAASLSDPRPRALRRLGRTLEGIVRRNHQDWK